jgi:hypothetical protein
MVVPLIPETNVFAAIPGPVTKLPTANPDEAPEITTAAVPDVTDPEAATRLNSGDCTNRNAAPVAVASVCET